MLKKVAPEANYERINGRSSKNLILVVLKNLLGGGWWVMDDHWWIITYGLGKKKNGLGVFLPFFFLALANKKNAKTLNKRIRKRKKNGGARGPWKRGKKTQAKNKPTARVADCSPFSQGFRRVFFEAHRLDNSQQQKNAKKTFRPSRIKNAKKTVPPK